MLFASLAIRNEHLRSNAVAKLAGRLCCISGSRPEGSAKASDDGNRDHEGDETVIGGHGSLLSSGVFEAALFATSHYVYTASETKSQHTFDMRGEKKITSRVQAKGFWVVWFLLPFTAQCVKTHGPIRGTLRTIQPLRKVCRVLCMRAVDTRHG